MESLKKLGYILILTAFTVWIGYMIFIFTAIFTGKKNSKKTNKTVVVDTIDTLSNSGR
ncbi:MAG: hypothetical protein GWP03_05700 [Proteobacteria bacterium]|nr:hypothetical protein [Pseudomonadota bacterium]